MTYMGIEYLDIELFKNPNLPSHVLSGLANIESGEGGRTQSKLRSIKTLNMGALKKGRNSMSKDVTSSDVAAAATPG